jgi:hypothetical protein
MMMTGRNTDRDRSHETVWPASPLRSSGLVSTDAGSRNLTELHSLYMCSNVIVVSSGENYPSLRSDSVQPCSSTVATGNCAFLDEDRVLANEGATGTSDRFLVITRRPALLPGDFLRNRDYFKANFFIICRTSSPLYMVPLLSTYRLSGPITPSLGSWSGSSMYPVSLPSFALPIRMPRL